MSRFLACYFLGLVCCGLVAQDLPTRFHDDFTRYRPYWTQYDSSLAKVRDGRMHLRQDAPTGRLFLLTEQHLGLRDNFAFEVAFTCAPSTPSGQMALVWSSTRDRRDGYALLIRPDGYLTIEATQNGESRLLRDWTKARKFKKPGKGNVLRLRKQRYHLYVEVNGREVFRFDFPGLQGKHHGLRLTGRMQATVDYFRLEASPLTLSLVEDMHVKALRFPLDTPINQPYRDEIAPVVSLRGRHLYFSWADTAVGPGAAQLALSQVEVGRNLAAPKPITGLPAAAQQTLAGLTYTRGNAWLATHDPVGLWPLRRVEDSAWLADAPLALPDLPPQAEPIDWYWPDDGRFLLVSAELPDGFGHRDLWVMARQADGSWGRPQNLGAEVNTFGDERTPYLDPETRQLYFSSNAQPGYGGLDVYRCESLGERWTHWSPPANLGPTINGPGDEWYYRPLKQQPRRAYLSAQDSVGSDFDLYQVRIPVDLTQAGLARITGRIIDQQHKTFVSGAQVVIMRITPDSLLSVKELQLDSIQYDVLVPFGEAYHLFAAKPGYLSVPDTLSLRVASAYREVQKNLYLRPIEPGMTIALEQVFFQRALPELLPESYPELAQLYRTLRSNPTLRIEIRGHTDNFGEESVLQALSEARAAKVRQYLLDRGIAPSRVSSRGFGSTQPIASNEDPTTRARNRRVEFRVLDL